MKKMTYREVSNTREAVFMKETFPDLDSNYLATEEKHLNLGIFSDRRVGKTC